MILQGQNFVFQKGITRRVFAHYPKVCEAYKFSLGILTSAICEIVADKGKNGRGFVTAGNLLIQALPGDALPSKTKKNQQMCALNRSLIPALSALPLNYFF